MSAISIGFFKSEFFSIFSIDTLIYTEGGTCIAMVNNQPGPNRLATYELHIWHKGSYIIKEFTTHSDMVRVYMSLPRFLIESAVESCGKVFSVSSQNKKPESSVWNPRKGDQYEKLKIVTEKAAAFFDAMHMTPFLYGVVMGQALSVFRLAIIDLVNESYRTKNHVWLLARDMDMIFYALRLIGVKVEYLRGLNRMNTGLLSNHGDLAKYVKAQGVKDGDILIDSGFRGSIVAKIQSAGIKVTGKLLSTQKDYGTSGNNSCRLPLISESFSDDIRRVVVRFEHGIKSEVTDWQNEQPVWHHDFPEFNALFNNYREGFVHGFLSDWTNWEIHLAQNLIKRWPDFEDSEIFTITDKHYWENDHWDMDDIETSYFMAMNSEMQKMVKGLIASHLTLNDFFEEHGITLARRDGYRIEVHINSESELRYIMAHYRNDSWHTMTYLDEAFTDNQYVVTIVDDAYQITDTDNASVYFIADKNLAESMQNKSYGNKPIAF